MTSEKKTDLRYCVFFVQQGRTKPGVHKRCVRVSGPCAFAIRPNGLEADIIPKANVHATIEAANAAFAGKGKLRWCVKFGESSWQRDCAPELFQAMVNYYSTGSGYRSYGRIVARREGKEEAETGSIRAYETKREATAAYRARKTELRKEATKTLREARALLASLAKGGAK